MAQIEHVDVSDNPSQYIYLHGPGLGNIACGARTLYSINWWKAVLEIIPLAFPPVRGVVGGRCSPVMLTRPMPGTGRGPTGSTSRPACYDPFGSQLAGQYRRL